MKKKMKLASRISVSRPISESGKAQKVVSGDIIPTSMGTRSLTPLDFENFIPWIVTELNGSKMVVVRKTLQVDNYQKSAKRGVRFVKTQKELIKLSRTSTASVKTLLTLPSDFEDEDAIELTATYDHCGNLVEIAFIDCLLPMNRQIMKIISLCLPFHAMLTKFTIKEKRLNCGILYEIAKFLPFSNLTDICLDSCYVLQGNYYILLDQSTSLKCLSLSNCDVSDVVCREIAERINFQRPASKNLLVLNLSCNKITDVGAEALGHALRTNRRLLHLNLCNNKLSAVGAHHILAHLTQFQLTTNEVIDMKRQVKEYSERKAAAVDKCLKQIRLSRSPATASHAARSSLARRQAVMGEGKGVTDYENAEMMAMNIVGPFDYAYAPANTVVKDGRRFCIGNLTLCSLNLGYNNLDFFSIVMIVEILEYQSFLDKSRGTGLMRLVIEGNNLPASCGEYNLINMYLNKVTDHYMPRSTPLSSKSHKNSSTSLNTVKSVKFVASQSWKRKP